MNLVRLLGIILIFVGIVGVTSQVHSATSDYAKLAYIDQTILVGVGLSFTKMETYSTVGNYFLLSQTNPRLDIRYVSKVEEKFRHTVHGYFVREQYAPENPSFFIRNREPVNRFGLTYQPQWFSEGNGVSYGFNLQLKRANVYSEVPTNASLVGNIAQRTSYEAGVAMKWYGQTVSKLPLSLDLDFSYVNHLAVDSTIDYMAGISYRLALDFDFGRRSYFSNFNIRAFYEYEKIDSSLHAVNTKELGVSLSRAISF
ncbi:hypothetical protein CIK05_03715 [Bdellovibrio sp. qaytius]|nr:hypothetical protein CIK05_03715 [Bdellovibrio sp. qaytius]